MRNLASRLHRISLDQLELGRYLAEGSFGEVHEARVRGVSADLVAKTVVQPTKEVRSASTSCGVVPTACP